MTPEQNEVRVPVLTQEIIHEEVHMMPGMEHVAVFDNLKGKVRGGYSWGKGAPNMSTVYDADRKAAANTREWMEKLHLPSQIVRINGKEGIIDKEGFGVMEITQEMVDEYKATHESADGVPAKVDFIYTKDPRITLMVKPADCPAVIVYAVNKKGERIVGVGHWGREGVDSKNPVQAFTRLIEEEGCDPRSIYIGITPGIGPEHHTLSYEDIIPADKKTPSKLRNWAEWNDRLTGPDNGPEPYNKKRYHIDLLGRIIDMLPRSIPRGHIEAYNVDTYKAAQRGETFSHRLSLVTKGEHPEARMVVAAALPFLVEE